MSIWLPIFFVVPNDYLFSMSFMIPTLVVVVINVAISLVGIWYISKLVISDEGIVLYGVNKLDWNDVVYACVAKFLGIKSIKIKRRKGLTWYLPLYMEGEITIRDAIINHAPENNALYKVAKELRIT